MNKRSIAVLVAGVAVASISTASCAREVVVVETPQTTVPAPTTTQPPATRPPVAVPSFSPTEAYIAEAYTIEYAYLSPFSDAETVEFGELVCDYFDSGGTANGLIDVIYQSGVESGVPEDAMMYLAGLAGVAVRHLCPEHIWRIA